MATGALVANLYYAQPLLAVIGPDIGVSPELAGSVVSVTQIGYGVGLFLLVSLADLVENRKLVLVTLAITALGLVGMATSTAPAPFFVAAFVIGLCSTGAQVLIPLMAHLTPPERRGRVVGNVMAGLLTGIMLARPLSLFIAASFGWRAVFWLSTVLMLGIWPRPRPHGATLSAARERLTTATSSARWPASCATCRFCAGGPPTRPCCSAPSTCSGRRYRCCWSSASG